MDNDYVLYTMALQILIGLLLVSVSGMHEYLLKIVYNVATCPGVSFFLDCMMVKSSPFYRLLSGESDKVLK